MSVVVRSATEADIDRMVELYAAVADEGRWLGAEGPVDRDDYRRRWVARLGPRESAGDGSGGDEAGHAARGGVHLVAEAEGVVVGQASLDLAPYGVASLGMLVDRDWRRRGAGAALVQAAVEVAHERGCHKVTLQVWPHNEAARALYRKFGFEEEGVLRHHYRRRNGDLWDAVIMGLVLDGPADPSPPPAVSDERAG